MRRYIKYEHQTLKSQTKCISSTILEIQWWWIMSVNTSPLTWKRLELQEKAFTAKVHKKEIANHNIPDRTLNVY